MYCPRSGEEKVILALVSPAFSGMYSKLNNPSLYAAIVKLGNKEISTQLQLVVNATALARGLKMFIV